MTAEEVIKFNSPCKKELKRRALIREHNRKMLSNARNANADLLEWCGDIIVGYCNKDDNTRFWGGYYSTKYSDFIVLSGVSDYEVYYYDNWRLFSVED